MSADGQAISSEGPSQRSRRKPMLAHCNIGWGCSGTVANPHQQMRAGAPEESLVKESDERLEADAFGVEGFYEAENDGWGDYPLDSVFVRSETRTVGEVVARINRHRYIMDPEFQREFVWDEGKQSKLIESCVMRIPLPVFYVAEADDGRVIVVDGLQRLTTFQRFKNGTLRLTLGAPEDQHPLKGKAFAELPLILQERIDDTQLTLYILDSKAPERARLDIFERVNSGEPLTRQQMRNALYNGPATRWLSAASSSALFRDVTGKSLAPKTMRDREAINRFCAFTLFDWPRYNGDMDAFLGEALDVMNGTPESDLAALRSSFDYSMDLNLRLFGRHAFRKSLATAGPNNARSVLNIALWDVFSVLLSRVRVADTAGMLQLKRVAKELFDDTQFWNAITFSTNSRLPVLERFRVAEQAFAEFFDK